MSGIEQNETMEIEERQVNAIRASQKQYTPDQDKLLDSLAYFLSREKDERDTGSILTKQQEILLHQAIFGAFSIYLRFGLEDEARSLMSNPRISVVTPKP